MIRQPDFVTEYRSSKAFPKKKPHLDTSKAKLETIDEGLCSDNAIGSYDDEPATIVALDNYAIQNGYALDC